MAYREFRPPPALSDVVVCTWERTVPRSAGPRDQRVLPDACVDLVWRDDELWVAGPDTTAVTSPLAPGETITGIRIRPGGAGALLGVPASELRDGRVPIDALWSRLGAQLVERVGAAETGARRRLLERAMLERRQVAREPDALVAEALRLLGRPGTRVGALASTVAISERQLLRRFEAAVGYGPKLADRVLRFQRLRARGRSGGEGLARIAAELGYADQAHLSRDCLELSGLTPTQLLGTRA